MADLQSRIEELWDRGVTPGDTEAESAVTEAVDLLDRGEARVAEIGEDGQVVVHQWLKQAVLLLFRLRSMETIEVGPYEFHDKIPLKHGYAGSGVRVVPGGRSTTK